MSRITVIIPVYKVESYLRRCVDSILSQTFSDFDIILIDDKSPDQCGVICEEYKMNDPRINVIHHKENLGLSAARNSGIDWAMNNSDSQWITFVDSDDWVTPIYLEALYEAVQGYGISVCRYIKTDGSTISSEITYTVLYKNTVESFQRPSEITSVAGGKLYLKDLFIVVRYPIGKLHEDEFVTYRLLFQFEIIPFIPQQLYNYYTNPDGIIHRPWTPQRMDILEAIEEQIAFFENKKYVDLAHRRFQALISISRTSLKNIKASGDLNDQEKYTLRKYIRKRLRRILLKYHKYHWASPFNRGDDLWLYSDTFTSVHLVHMLWRKLKHFYHSISQSNN